MKIAPKSDPKGDHFFNIFVHRLWERVGANLAPKTLPKWSQIGSKIEASWGVDLTLVLAVSYTHLTLPTSDLV